MSKISKIVMGTGVLIAGMVIGACVANYMVCKKALDDLQKDDFDEDFDFFDGLDDLDDYKCEDLNEKKINHKE